MILKDCKMTKGEKIHQEWKNLIPNDKINYCLSTGWCVSYCVNGINDVISEFPTVEDKIEFESCSYDILKWRPKTLQGIENNNGWICINSEDDLPKNESIDVMIKSEPYQGYVYQGYKKWYCILENRYGSKELDDDESIPAAEITHYQLIIKPKLPLH